MCRFNYDNRHFVGVVNYDDGDFTRQTVFHYRQIEDVVWGTYRGGGVVFGTLVARVNDNGELDMRWQHASTDGTLKTGTSRSVPEQLSDGRLRLHEQWCTTSGQRTGGTSVVEERPPDSSSTGAE